MNTDLKKLLDELPDKPPRSRLEPYREFIEELRRRGRTYRDIAEVLAEKCAVHVTASGVHDYIRTRKQAKLKKEANYPNKTKRLPADGPLAADTLASASSSEELQRKIAALKASNKPAESGLRGFEYDPDEPLRLKRPQRQ